MKKTLFLILMMMSIFLYGCESWVDLTEEGLDTMYEEYIKVLNNLSLSNYYFLQKNSVNNNEYYYHEVVAETNENNFQMKEKNIQFEKYYKDGYLYHYDISTKQKTKEQYDFNNLDYLALVNNYFDKLKIISEEEKYIENISGKNRYSFNKLFDTGFGIDFNESKLNDDKIFDGIIFGPHVLVIFNPDLTVDCIEFEININGIFQRIVIGNLYINSIEYPDDLDDIDTEFVGYYGKAPTFSLANLDVCSSIAISFGTNNKSTGDDMISNNSIEQVEFMTYKLFLSPSFLVGSPIHVSSKLYQGKFNSYILFEDGIQSGYFVESNYLDPSLVDLNKHYYSFIACNGENYENYPSDLGTLIGKKNINNHQITFYSLKEKKSYGEHLSVYGTFEEDGNKYTFGAKYIYKDVNINSDAIKYVNEKSSFAIKLGTKDENIDDISDYNKYDWEGLSCGYKLTNKTGDEYRIGPFYNSNRENYVTSFETVSKDVDICGIKCGMSYNEIKDALTKQGFEEIVNRPAEATFLYGNVILKIRKNGYDSDLVGNIKIYSITITIAYSTDITVMID